MLERINRGIKKVKGKIITGVVLWVVLTIAFVSPLAIGIHAINMNDDQWFVAFSEAMGEHLMKPFINLGTSLSAEYIGTFWSVFWKFSLLYMVLLTMAIYKAIPKGDYGDIEHGSSDWSEGEQYKILNKNKGILLAEKHYLPVNKRGNVNVLVVGRIRFW